MSSRGQGTEGIDPRFAEIEQWPTGEAVQALLDDQIAGLEQARRVAPALAMAAEAAAERLRSGIGRLVYAGAGTSGRIAVQDGVELRPTYGWPMERLLFLLAGGDKAITESVEGAEDDQEAGRREVAGHAIGPADVVLCVAASGRTPFTCAVAEAAREAGALTVGFVNNLDAPLSALVEHAIEAATGPEVIAGSTRMKAGTAQKALLNAFSTAVMIRLGLVRRGLMVSMRVSNQKLRTRSVDIVSLAAGVGRAEALDALEQSGFDIPAAIRNAGSGPDTSRRS